MSFLMDPPLLVATGAATGAVVPQGSATSLARAAAVGGFIGVSAALYANVPAVAERWPTLGARSGREFMLTSGLARVDERRMGTLQHAAALSLFALYPVWFELGRRLAGR